MTEIGSVYNITHKPTVVYSPWASGTVERLNRDILSALLAILAELKLAPQDWTQEIDLIQTEINEAPTSLLGQNYSVSARSLLEVMTGISSRRAIFRILCESETPFPPCSMTRVAAVLLRYISKIQANMEAVHKEIGDLIETRRPLSIDAHNTATNIVSLKFLVGDFVLVCLPDMLIHKLYFRWCGPLRFISCHSPFVYTVDHLSSEKQQRVHCARMIL